MCRGKFRRSGAEIGHLPPLCAGKQRITRASKGRRRGRRRKRGWKSRDLSRSRPGGRVPLPPPEIRPLILVPHLPCAVSLKHRQMSLEAVRGDSSRISGQFYKFFFISQKREVLEKFRGIIFGGNSCGGIFISRWSIFFFFFLRSKECRRWFECENSRTKRDMTILYL